jgi:hypothetical protein
MINHSWLIVCFTIINLACVPCRAQQDRLNIGIGYKAGFSQTAEFEIQKVTVTNTASHTPIFSYSLVGYGVWKFNKSEKPSLLENIRVSISSSYRSGIFGVGDSLAKVSFSYIDWDISLPLQYRVSPELNFYFAVGGNASFLIRQTKGTSKANFLQPGLLAEMGISTIHGSYFAFQILGTYTHQYSLQNLAFTFGMTFNEAKASNQKNNN